MDTTNKPYKISPNYIVDSLFSFDYESDYSFRKIQENLSLVLSAYSKNEGVESFQEYPIISSSLCEPQPDGTNVQTSFSNDHPTGKTLLSNGIYKIQLDSSKIQFNIVSEYIGWSSYFSLMGHVVCPLCTNGIISIMSASSHFVDFLENISLFEGDTIDGSIRLNQLQMFEGTELRFNCTAHNAHVGSESKVNVILTEKVRNGDKYGSYIDVEVISNLDSFHANHNNDNIQSVILDLHGVQEDIFFKLLSNKFVESHNPQYPTGNGDN